MNYYHLFLVAALTLPAGTLFGQEEEHGHFDIFVGQPTAGTQTIIGGAEEDGEIELDARIFEADLAVASQFGENFFTATEPGLLNEDSPWPLNEGEKVTVNSVPYTFAGVTSELFYWNGVGSVAFMDATLSGTALEITQSPEMADEHGDFHDHPIFDVTLGSATLPDEGIYLAPINVELEGLDASETAFVLLVAGEDFEDFVEAAEDYVAGQLVPEPSTLLLVVLSLVGVLAIKR